MMDKPIIFSAPMIRALLVGRKTMTRRIMKGITTADAVEYGRPYQQSDDGVWRPIPSRYAVGDRLWVRETVRADELEDGSDGVRYVADGAWRIIENTEAASDRWVELNHYRGRRGATVPSIRMPRWCSRLTLVVTDVKVERIQNISEEDAIAEGVRALDGQLAGCFVVDGSTAMSGTTARECFFRLWNSIHGTGSWDKNPFVVAPTFEVHHCNIDRLTKVAA